MGSSVHYLNLQNICFFLFCMAIQVVQAASFDCTKAATSVEKLICADKELSGLDDNLATSYQRARETSNDKATLQRKQVEWLKGRSICKDKACLRQAYESRIAALNTASAPVKSNSDKSPQDAGKYRFEILKGAGTPVCDAYLERLNTADFKSPPYCGRPEETTVSGFTALHRIPLTADEVFVLMPRVTTFMTYGNQGSREEDIRRNPDAWGSRKQMFSTIDQFMKLGQTFAWRYDPHADIANDGERNSVIIWQVLGASHSTLICEDIPGKPEFSNPVRQHQIPFIVEPSNARLDETKTKMVFAHPSGGYQLQDGVTTRDFRPVGKAIGIFKYMDLYYFDTFFDSWGDFEGKRKGENNIESILGVFLHQNGKTRQVCEYRMTEI